MQSRQLPTCTRGRLYRYDASFYPPVAEDPESDTSDGLRYFGGIVQSSESVPHEAFLLIDCALICRSWTPEGPFTLRPKAEALAQGATSFTVKLSDDMLIEPAMVVLTPEWKKNSPSFEIATADFFCYDWSSNSAERSKECSIYRDRVLFKQRNIEDASVTEFLTIGCSKTKSNKSLFPLKTSDSGKASKSTKPGVASPQRVSKHKSTAKGKGKTKDGSSSASQDEQPEKQGWQTIPWTTWGWVDDTEEMFDARQNGVHCLWVHKSSSSVENADGATKVHHFVPESLVDD